MNFSASVEAASRYGVPFFNSLMALSVQAPVCSTSTGLPATARFIGTIENCMLPPPCTKITAYSSGIAISLRIEASARVIISSNSAERWLISITDIPVPR